MLCRLSTLISAITRPRVYLSLTGQKAFSKSSGDRTRALVKSLTYGTSNSEEAVSMGVGVEASNLSSMIMVQAVAWSPGSIDKSQSSLPLEVTCMLALPT